jgi:hypothetical protein
MTSLHAGALRTAPRVAKRRRTRGALMVEYAFLLFAFGIPVMVATIATGVNLVKSYTATRNLILHAGP